jgi:hypothetical protein
VNIRAACYERSSTPTPRRSKLTDLLPTLATKRGIALDVHPELLDGGRVAVDGPLAAAA